MSHIEEGTTSLKLTGLAAVMKQGDPAAIAQHPCMLLLRQAVTLVASERGGSVDTTYADYHYQPQATNLHLALSIPELLPRGIGLVLNLETGALTFQGDPWRHRAGVEEVQQRIVQHYQVLAYAAALRRMRAQVTVETMENQVVLTGVFHG